MIQAPKPEPQIMRYELTELNLLFLFALGDGAYTRGSTAPRRKPACRTLLVRQVSPLVETALGEAALRRSTGRQQQETCKNHNAKLYHGNTPVWAGASYHATRVLRRRFGRLGKVGPTQMPSMHFGRNLRLWNRRLVSRHCSRNVGHEH